MNNVSLRFGKRGVAFLLIAALLSGCAGEREHREGMTLLDQGRYEEGLAKLEAASKAQPDNVEYRSALKRNRELAVIHLLEIANAEKSRGHVDAARIAFEKALVIDPTSDQARRGLDNLEMDKRHEANLAEARADFAKGDVEAARAALKPVLLEDPKNGDAVLLQRQIDELAARESDETPSLRAKFKKPVTLQFRDANIKMVFEALSRTSGINVLLDKDVKPDIKVSIFVKDVSVEDTIDLILLQSQLEKKVLNDNTLFIYPNTPAKLKDYQDLKIRSFHLTHADPKQMLTMLKTLLKTKDIFIHEKTNSIVMRDTPEAIRLAEKMIADQDVPEPEVMMEVEVLEVSRTKLEQLGLQWPDQLVFTSPQGATTTTTAGVNNTTPVPLTWNQLRHTGIGNYLVNPLSLTLNLHLDDSDTKVLASPRIRARNHEKAKIMIGDRLPVITNAVTPVSTGTPVVTGSVQYLDVGLKLEIEPDIHANNDVAMKLNLEVSSLTKEVQNPTSGTLAYQIGTRNASTTLRLKDGETQILAGLINDQDRETAAKVPGLGQMPVLGRLFSSHSDNAQKTEIVLSITPHVVSPVTVPDANDVEYWSGTESTLRSTPVTITPENEKKPRNPVVRGSPTLPPSSMTPTPAPAPVNPAPVAPPAPSPVPAPAAPTQGAVPAAPNPSTPPPPAQGQGTVPAAVPEKTGSNAALRPRVLLGTRLPRTPDILARV